MPTMHREIGPDGKLLIWFQFETSPLANPFMLHDEHVVLYLAEMACRTKDNSRETGKWHKRLHDEIWPHSTPIWTMVH